MDTLEAELGKNFDPEATSKGIFFSCSPKSGNLDLIRDRRVPKLVFRPRRV